MSTEITISLHVLILSIGVIQGVVLATCLMTLGQRTNRANWLLGLTILSYSLMLVDDVLFESRLLLRCPYLADIFSLFVFATAPTLHLYFRSITHSDRPVRRTDLVHYLPLALFALLFIPSVFEDPTTRLEYVKSLYETDQFYFNPVIIIPLAQVLAYLGVIGGGLIQHARAIRLEYSALEKVSLRWISYLLTGFALACIGWLVSYLMKWQLGIQALDLAYTAFVYVFGYIGWRQKEIRPVVVAVSADDADETQTEKPKYAKSGMTLEQKGELQSRLLRLMTTGRPFLDPDLSLTGLSEQLSALPHNLSRVINEDLNLTFHEFVNRYRVEEAKRLLSHSDTKDGKILAIALDAGFNSKSSFNAAFRKYAGMTPSEFREAVLDASAKKAS